MGLVALLVVASCSAERTPSAEPTPTIDRSSPPPAGLSILYATTGPTDVARINRFDLRSEKTTLLTADEAERFGELVGRNYARGERERALGAWIPSPSGRYMARLTFEDLSIASADTPLGLRRIARATTTNHSLGGLAGGPDQTHVIWAPDDSRLFYLESREGPKPPPNVETHNAPAEMSLFEVRRDGSARRLVKRFSTPKFVELIGFDAQEENVYWVRTGPGGGVFDLTAVALADGKARVVDALVPAWWIRVSPAGDKAYVIESPRRIVEIALPGGRRRIVYQGDTQTMPIQSIEISPDGESIAYEERNEGTTTARVLSLEDGSSRTLWTDADNDRPRLWSPDGRYLLLDAQADCAVPNPNLRVVDLANGEIQRLNLDRITCPAEATDAGHPRYIFIAWLTDAG